MITEGVSRAAGVLAAAAANGGFAAYAGACAARLTMPSGSRWSESAVGSTRRWVVGGIVVIGLAEVARFVLVALSFAEDGSDTTGGLLITLLVHSRFGLLWLVGMAVLVVAMVVAAAASNRPPSSPATVVLLALAVAFAASRASTSHAAATGDAVPILVQWVHLLSTALWAGLVWWAAFCPLPGAGSAAADCAAASRWVIRLSSIATAALVTVVITGSVSGWSRLTSPDALRSAYGVMLGIKLGLVGVSAMLGACNRFIVLPRLVEPSTYSSTLRKRDAPSMFGRVLRVEAVMLCAVIAAASVLAATEPP